MKTESPWLHLFYRSVLSVSCKKISIEMVFKVAYKWMILMNHNTFHFKIHVSTETYAIFSYTVQSDGSWIYNK